ncbi:hypothetical protein JCGZ_05133 [Jatropha curcas]|uniref:Uncharacterized protein n=1 Tax=Jatropha curcas TaxID=180498 RepID=A0A067KRR1_JATCU|nr:hypothetical protein JCGZ_05133 [Jatropha curcas]
MGLGAKLEAHHIIHMVGEDVPRLEIFADVIDILAVEPKVVEEKKQKEDEKEPEQEGVERPRVIEEEENKKKEQEEGQVAQVKEEEYNKEKASTNKEEEDPAE